MPTITKEQIQAVADKIAKEFQPEKIILFGSYAWGKPHADSDIDLCIVKKTYDSRDLARQIDSALSPRIFPIDLLVYAPSVLKEKIEVDHNLFLEDVVKNGRILYEHN